MAENFDSLHPEHKTFIARQRIFFTAFAAAAGRVNVSPRPTDALRIIDGRNVAYRDLTGSGSETSAHVLANGRLTMMFCAFEGPPRILRLFGVGFTARVGTPSYDRLLREVFDGEEPRGTRQIVRLDIDLVRTSCGYGVPLFTYQGERPTLRRWTDSKSDADLVKYRAHNNARSIDGFPAGFGESPQSDS